MLTMVIVVRLGRPSRQTLRLQFQASEALNRALVKEWAQNHFVRVSDQNLLKGGVSNLLSHVAGISGLDDPQRNGLSDELMTFFRAYNAGDYDAYRTFRFPPGISFQWKTNKFGPIDVELNEGPYFGPPYALTRWRQQIEHHRNNFDSMSQEDKFKMFLKLYSGETLYSNYFNAVCLDQARVVLNNFSNDIVKPWKIQFYAPNTFNTNGSIATCLYPNLGYFSQEPVYSFVRFSDSLESIRDQFGQVEVADCYFFIRRPPPDTVTPVILRLYWNPSATRWLPGDLVVCNLWRKGNCWPLF